MTMDGQSLDLTKERLSLLESLFPDVFSEGLLDWSRLRQALGEESFVDSEHYELTWAGKSEARREIQRQTTATLIPDRDASVNFDESKNIFIEGENLEVLRVLQRSYFGRIKLIYIDPPYNTGNDSFIYPDDYTERLEDYQQRTGMVDNNGFLNKQDLWRLNRREGRFHSSWLSMMYPRLFLARNLLREDGIIFISIDDNEASNLKLLMDEIFGSENFVANICWQKKYAPANDTIDFSPTHDFLLVYIKNRKTTESGKPIAAISRQERSAEQNKAYKNPDQDERGLWKTGDYTCNKTAEQRPNLYYPILHPKTGEEIWPSRTAVWRYSKEKHAQNVKEKRVWWGINGDNKVPAYKRFLSEVPDIVAQTWWPFDEVGHNDEAKKELQKLFPESPSVFDTPKPVRLIKKILKLCLGPDDLVLDFFAGSATTAHAVLELNLEDGGNREFILVQIPEVIDPKNEAVKAGYNTIADVSRDRIRRAILKMDLQTSELNSTILKHSSELVELQEKLKELNEKDPALLQSHEKDKNTQRLINRRTELEALLQDKQSQLQKRNNTAKDFKAFKIAPSNFRVWRSQGTDKEQIKQLLLSFTQSDKDDADSEKMLYEFLLKKGFELTARIDKLDFNGIKVYSVENGKMLVLLEGYNQAINDQIIEARPQHVVCLDRLFAGQDEILTNLQLDLRDRGINLSII